MKKKETQPKPAKEKASFPFGYLLFALTFIALGVCFIAFTSQSIDMMCYLIGGVTVFAALINAVLALADKNRGFSFYFRLILCALAVTCGVVVIVSKKEALEYIVGAIAFLLVIDASFKLQTTVKSKASRLPFWWVTMILIAACYALEGFLLKFYDVDETARMVTFLGIALVLDGLLNLFTPFLLSAIAKKERKESLPKAEDASQESENPATEEPNEA